MARPKKKKLIILLGRYADLAIADLDNEITDGINEVIVGQGSRAAAIFAGDPEGENWTKEHEDVFDAVDALADASSDYETLSASLEDALVEAGL